MSCLPYPAIGMPTPRELVIFCRGVSARPSSRRGRYPGAVEDWFTWATVLLSGLSLVAPVALGVQALRRPDLRFTIERDAADIRSNLPTVDAPPEDRQYALLREYHSRGIAQSTQSFWFSLAAASLGFLVILSAVVVIAFQISAEGSSLSALLPGIQLVSGVIIEAVAALFFVQSNKARALMADFFDKLREDRKLEESLRLVEKMDSGPTKERVQALLALTFSGSVNDNLAASVLVIPSASREERP